MSRLVRFWDRIADHYSRKPVPDEAIFRKKLEITREYLSPETKLLELGCGTGSVALLHAPYVKSVHAIDFSAKMLAIARAKAEQAGIVNIDFEQCAIEELSAMDGSYDLALALSVLHLLEDRRAALEQIFRLLKPGGVFISSTTCLADGMSWFGPIAAVGHALGLLPLVKLFTLERLKLDLAESGFVIEREWHTGRGKALFLVAKKP